MFERKAAVIDISKGLITVSLATLTAIGGAIANPALAGIPAAGLAAMGTIDPWLTKLKGKKEAQLEIPVPSWWSRSDAQSWQTACTSIENRLPSIINSTAARLRKESEIPTTAIVQQAFLSEIVSQMPDWDVSVQDRGLTAVTVAEPLLKKMSEVLDTAVEPIREDALAKEVQEISKVIKQLAVEIHIARATSTLPPIVVTPSPTAPSAQQEAASITELQRKWENDEFDVYICYHKDDEQVVSEIDTQLKKRGILPWFDIEAENPSVTMLSTKNVQLRKIKAGAVFIGKNAMDKWQVTDVEALITQFVERGIGVIPVFLKDAPPRPEMSVFLELFRGVDFRRQKPDPFGQLVWGITGKKPPLQL